MDKKQRLTIVKILHRLKKYWISLILSLLLAFVQVSMTLYIPILVGNAIDCIIDAGQVVFTLLRSFLVKIVVCTCIAAFCQWAMNELNNQVTYRVTRNMRREVFYHIQQLPLSYLDDHPHGDMVSRVVSDVDTFADGLLMGFTQLFTGVITIVGTLGIMLHISWPIALVVLFITPLSLLVAKFIAQKTFSMFQLQAKTRGEQTALLNETINGLKVVKAFCHEKESLAAFDEVNHRLEQCSLQAIFFSSLTNPCTRFVNSVVYAGVGLAGSLIAISGGISIGNLTSFLNYANQYTKPFNEISGVITELQNALACADRVFELIETPTMRTDFANTKVPEHITGAMQIKDLAFSYVPTKPLIRNFNLSVQPGQKIAVVGPTGCGKTTLINLLMRFYDPNAGSITLDGVNTANMERKYLRKNIGMVLQDTWLKTGTVRENIAMGKPNATDAEIIQAAKLAHAHNFIMQLPEKYNTQIGEAGSSFSQGQRQLLCIARVMLCLPPMLILDEATSSIDTRTEKNIQDAFNRMMEGRTSFIVAHRLSTIQEADLILVMKDGCIVEQGTHRELLKKHGFYCQLYESQFAI